MRKHWLQRTSSLCSACALVAGVYAAPVLANPQGGNVAAGSATITESGSKLDVHQHTNKAVIDWRSFDIDVGEHTQFHQPSSSATALNRVNSTDPSRIAGKLSANGNVILVNPNGVFFEGSAQVDVNGLIATTADIDNTDFMAGKLDFNKPGNPDAAVVNAGTITAKEAGLVGLVAPNVENHGVINAKLGKVQLASGDTFMVDLYGDGLFEINVSDEVTSQLVANTGSITAEGGTIAITAAAGKDIVNSLVTIEGELKAPTIQKKGGKVIIAAAGSTAISGNKADDKGKKQGSSTVLIANAHIDASGRDAGEQGGEIEITADNIGILENTIIDASGHSALVVSAPNKKDSATLTADKTVRREEEFLAHENRAGGSIKIGGDYLGTGDTAAASYVYVDANSLILNDAIHTGDGGRTIIWSDDSTDFYGNVISRGGVNSGNGGFLETSGKLMLDAQGFADLTNRAEGYAKGTYLLDPANITIYGGVDPTFASTDGSINLSTDLTLWLDAADASQVELTYSTDALGGATANGTLGTNTITTSADVSANLAVGARIRLGAQGNIETADTLGADTYTITAIAGTTITVAETLMATYAGDDLRRGLVSEWRDKAGTNHATQSTESKMGLWVSNGQNNQGTIIFDGSSDSYTVANISLGSNISVLSSLEKSSGLIIMEHSPNANGQNGFYFNAASNRPVLVRNGNVTLLPTSDVWLDTNDAIVGFTYDGANLDYFHNSFVDGGTTGSITNNVVTDNLYIGSRAGTTAYFGGQQNEHLIYSSPLPTARRNLVEQYQSAKWGIALLDSDPATELALATAHNSLDPTDPATNGFSAFSADYLERLSATADIVLHADDTITLDLQGDTLTLVDDRSITLRTDNGAITDASAGTIQTAGTGGIALDAGGAINLDSTTLTTAGGNITFDATGGITLGGTTALNPNGGDVTFNDALTLTNNLTIASAAGDVTLNRVDGAFDLTVNANAITTNAAIGQTTALDAVSLTSASTLSLPTIEAASIAVTTSAGDISGAGGITTTGGNIVLNAANDLDLRNVGILSNNGNLDFDAGRDAHLSSWIDTGTGTLNVDAARNITLTTPDLTSGLVGHWSFDEGSGVTASDSSGNGNVGTLTGDATWSVDTPSNTGGSISLDGAGDYVAIGDSNSLDVDTTTVSAWVNGNDWTDADRKGVFIKNGAYYLTIVPSGKIQVYGYDKAPAGYHESNAALSTGSWHHIAMTLSEYEFSIYIDGVLDRKINSSGVIRNTGSPAAIGAEGIGTARYFDGLMDDVRVYSTALSEFEVAALSGNPTQWTTGATSFTAGNNITLNNGIDVGANTLTLTATAGSINSNVNTLTADTINFDAGGTISADVAAMTAIDIANNSTAATLTGTLGGLGTQTEADAITGGPRNDANYTFEGFTIGYVAPPSGGGGGGGSTPVDDTGPKEPTSPEEPVVQDDPADPIDNTDTPTDEVDNTPTDNPTTDNSIDIPSTVEINSQNPVVMAETILINTASTSGNSSDTVETATAGSGDNGSGDAAAEEETEENKTGNVRDNSKRTKKMLGGLVTIHPSLVKLLGLEEDQRIF